MQSVEQFSDVIGTTNPDLATFRKRGGKIVMWHGWSDQLIYAGGSIDYFTRVQAAAGGPAPTASFFRFFLAPGVAHCGGGAGPAPTGTIEALLTWVEENKAPEMLQATRRDQDTTRTRPLCQYPQVAKYKGSGSTNDAANFSCSSGF